MMRNNILSFLSAAFVAVTVFSAYHFISQTNTSRQAQASPISGAGAEIKQQTRLARKTHNNLAKAIAARPDALLDLRAEDVLKALKAPELVREDFPTMVWQYRDPACVLDIYFKANKAGAKDAPVIHYEVRLRDEKQVEEQAAQLPQCIQAITRQQTSPRMLKANAVYKAL